MFLVAFRRQTDKLTDISYALSFVALVVVGLVMGRPSATKLLIASMVAIWAGRLGGYLLVRIQRIGRDKRFDGMRTHFWSFGRFWLLQGASVWVISLAALLALTSRDVLFYPVSLLGVVIWAVGLIIEGVADRQKFAFINDPANKGKWIESGVWRYSRHPNYFGEIMVWLGIFLAAVPTLAGVAMGLAAVSPVFITALLLFISGVPPLERSADLRWGKDAAYQAYKARTSLLIPLPPKG
jgi:steroid 5-alpha reductase family enzyme